MRCRKYICLAAAAGVLATLLPAGCDRRPLAPTTSPATRPATKASSEHPDRAEFAIDWRPFSFDAPRVSLERDGTPRVLIYSAKDSVAGSFYFEVPLEPESRFADGITFEQRLQQRELQDSLIGIQLARTKQTLQPQILRISIKPLQENAVEVSIEGQFLVYDMDQTTTTTTCSVQAHFLAAVEHEQNK